LETSQNTGFRSGGPVCCLGRYTNRVSIFLLPLLKLKKSFQTTKLTVMVKFDVETNGGKKQCRIVECPYCGSWDIVLDHVYMKNEVFYCIQCKMRWIDKISGSKMNKPDKPADNKNGYSDYKFVTRGLLIWAITFTIIAVIVNYCV